MNALNKSISIYIHSISKTIIYNVNNGTIKINDTLVDTLSPLKNKIKSICLKKKSFKKRKLELINGNLYDKIIIKILPFIIRN